MQTMDPMAVLDRAAHRQHAEEKGALAISDAISRLILGLNPAHAFFATLACRFVDQEAPSPIPDWDIETAMTDGKRIRYNPDWYVGLSPDHQVFVIAHEVMHPALQHHARRGDRDHKTWNIAADLTINPALKQAGLKPLPCARMPGEGPHAELPPDLSAEEYYDLLRNKHQGKEEQDGGGEGEGEGEGQGEGNGEGEDGASGGVEDAGDGSPADQRQAEAEWEVAVTQAQEAAKRRGNLSGGLARLVAQTLAPKVDWKEQLREFVSRNARNDYSWRRPRRSLVGQGIYLPGLQSQDLGDVAVAVDTSGSIGQRELEVFAAEIQAILDAFDCSLTVLYHDSRVCHVQTWKSSDGPLKLEPRGGGGTSHVPVFEWIEKMDDLPTCLVCLTDLCSTFPTSAPEYPVLWATTLSGTKGPWGQTLEVI